MFVWLNKFGGYQVWEGPQGFQVLPPTHLLVKNASTMRTCLVNVCLLMNMNKGKWNT